ncbi:hypothetical protein GCM10015535_65130 [Streptomyces gelaticus]|uniref:Uncharacterized protein n=1 Tax=Streptomyces gelaticus TaxID=285446 RepID=A0ABQ2WAT2_9ACTN|nr:hypothetical protein GCM10015535_65130 [Streptomyces gelaticus]
MDLDAQGAADRLQVEVEPEAPTGRDAVQHGVGDELAHAEQHLVGAFLARPVDQSVTHELPYERYGSAFPAVEHLAEAGKLSCLVHDSNVTQSHYR